MGSIEDLIRLNREMTVALEDHSRFLLTLSDELFRLKWAIHAMRSERDTALREGEEREPHYAAKEIRKLRERASEHELAGRACEAANEADMAIEHFNNAEYYTSLANRMVAT